MNAELKRRILSDSGIGVPFAQTKILNLNLEYAMTTRVIALDLDGTLLTPKDPASFIDRSPARAREAGYRLIIVTGRHHVAIHPFIRRWRWIHLLFAVTAPICMIIMQNRTRSGPNAC